MVESITYKYINGSLAQEYAANWRVESQNLPSGSTLETSEVPSQLTITVPANNTSSTRSGKIVLLQPASGKRITLNYSQEPDIVELKWTGVSVNSYTFSLSNRENATMVFNPLEKTLIYYSNSSNSNNLQIFNGLGAIISVIWGNRVDMSGSVTETSNGYTFTPDYVQVFDVDGNRVVSQSVVQPSTWVIQKNSNNQWVNWQSTYTILWTSGMTQYYQLQFAPYTR